MKIAFFLALYFPSIASAQSLNVAVASNFVAPFKVLKQEFEKTSESQLVMISGSSGKLATQMQQGAPYDIFLSADRKRVNKLTADNLTIKDSRMSYARGQLALLTPQKRVGQISLKKDIHHLALANPKLAPYGKAAKEALQNWRLWKELREKLVFGENISQTYQFLATGAADAGLVAYSQIKNREKKKFYKVIPQKSHTPITQDAIILKKSNNKKAAKKFLRFMKSERGRNIIRSFGYLPSAKKEAP